MTTNRANKKRDRNKRSLRMSIVVMLELILLSVSLTFAWFDRVLDPMLKGANIPTAPFQSSTFLVGARNDRTVELTNFFEESCNAKFSPIFSYDGKEFYSITNPSLKLGSSQIYSAALDFRFKVALETDKMVGKCDFWIEQLAIRVDGETVFSTSERGAESNLPSIDMNHVENATEEATEASTSESLDVDLTDNQQTTGEGATEILPSESIDASEIEQTIAPEDADDNTSSGYEKCFYMAFHGCGSQMVCDANICTDRILFAEADKYLYGNDYGNALFTHIATDGGEETVIDCTIWYQPTDGIFVPAGAVVSIELVLTSSWAETTTIYLTDGTTMLDELYPGLDENDYDVELVHISSGAVYPAIYDNETRTWCAEVPIAVEKFNIRYRSKGIGRDVLATWSNINGEEVHSFVLMDEGVFIKSER